MKCSTYTGILSSSSMGWASHIFPGVRSFSRHKPEHLSWGRRAWGGPAVPGRRRGGHEEEEGTRKKRALLDLIQTPLESVGAFPH